MEAKRECVVTEDHPEIRHGPQYEGLGPRTTRRHAIDDNASERHSQPILRSTRAAPTGGMHYHPFNTGATPARYLSVTMGSMQYPFVDENVRMFAGGMDTDERQGGNQVEYDSEDPRIRAMFERALETAGIASKMA